MKDTIKARKPTKKDIKWWKKHREEEIEVACQKEVAVGIGKHIEGEPLKDRIEWEITNCGMCETSINGEKLAEILADLYRKVDGG